MKAPRSILAFSVVALVILAVTLPATAAADFGLNAVSAVAEEADGTIDLQSGSHPFTYKVDIGLNPGHYGYEPVRSLIVDLPAGFIGNPQAVPQCAAVALEGTNSLCPPSTQVGEVEIVYGNPTTPGAEPIHAKKSLFNLSTPVGVPARLGFSVVGLNSFQEASLRSADNGVSVSDVTLPSIELISLTERIWGVPSDPRHDPFRQCPGGEEFGCSSEVPERPFLSLPTSCGGPLVTTVRVDTLANSGVFDTRSARSVDGNGTEKGLENCEAEPFKPTLSAQPQTAASDSPTGLDVGIKVPQSEGPKGLATAHLKDVSISLPAGLAVNPSAADGLAACPLEGSEGVNLPKASDPMVPEPAAVSEAAKCPPASKIGTVAVDTPLLDHPVSGEVFLAKQGANPFGSLIALYIALDDPISGTVVKLAGEVEPDPATGQLRATFLNNPQLPFENLDFSFFGGPRATLTTPQTCGTYTTSAALTPWSSPEGATAARQSSFAITQSPAGGCPTTEAQMPNSPGFEAGTTQPLAGSYSPFVLKLTRENGSQRFRGLNVTLPPGVAARFAGVAECSDSQIAQAQARSGLGQGALEAAQPSCPQGSELGTITVGAGSGSPIYVQGHAYLAGPYKGAPFSIAFITPVIAGPFDLGTVVVRAALYVDPTTAQGSVKSDPLPTILAGIPLDVRSIAVQINRPTFTLNPTNCETMAVGAEAISDTGQVANLQNRFQVGGCKGLAFKPKLSLKLSGSPKRAKNPSVRAVLTQLGGEANLKRVAVILPRWEFIDNRHINNPCTRVQFNAGAGNGANCPKNSILGHARAFTPLLDTPLEGPVYFRSNGGERKLPDIVASLGGQVHLNVVGFVDSVHKKGSDVSRVRNTFATIPDAPVSKFVLTLKGGKQGLLQNSANLCKVKNQALVKTVGQNGADYNTSIAVANSCPKKNNKRKKQAAPNR